MIITEISMQKKNSNRYSIFVDGKYTFSIEDIDLVKSKLKIGQTLEQREIDYYIEIYEFAKAKDKALRFISFKKRSEGEVESKLLLLGFSSEIVDRVVEYLKKLGYLDDDKFVDSFVNNTMKIKPCGKRLIVQQLKNKGISDKLIEEKLEQIELDEYNIARNLISKKLSRIGTLNDENYRKLYSFLLRKGFSSNLVLSILKEFQ